MSWTLESGSWTLEHDNRIILLLRVGIGSIMSCTLQHGSWTLEPGSCIFFHYCELVLGVGSWTLEHRSGIFYTIVSWYWEYYELDIRAWELDFLLL